jgi:glycosyltransferase involved in cell wall biosynthesis
MKQRRFRLLVAAENIPNIGVGLGYFLINGLRHLAQVHTDWQITVIASSSFRKLSEINIDNINVIYWDDTFVQRSASKFVQKLLPDSHTSGGIYLNNYTSAATYFISGMLPFSKLKSMFGDIKGLYNSLPTHDIIWVPHYSIVGGDRFSSLLNLNSLDIPILFTIHDIHPVYFPDDWSIDAKNSFWEGFVVFARKSNSIITHSFFQKESIIEKLNIDAEKIHVTPCPPLIEVSEFKKDYLEGEINDTLKRFHIKSPFALFPGSGGHTHKNHVRLLLAWAKLKDYFHEKCPLLVCTAKGHLWPSIKQTINALGLDDNVVFTDSVDTTTLVKLYRGCLFVVVPTLYEGGGSGPVAEAIIAGKPVVCSDISPIKEQLQTYNITYPTEGIRLFDPESVDSITQALIIAINNITTDNKQIIVFQNNLVSHTERLWKNWATYYAQQISQISFHT